MKGGFSDYPMPEGRNTSYTDKKKITGITFLSRKIFLETLKSISLLFLIPYLFFSLKRFTQK